MSNLSSMGERFERGPVLITRLPIQMGWFSEARANADRGLT
jgi:hypothetical protein